jgi:hypothetical protein
MTIEPKQSLEAGVMGDESHEREMAKRLDRSGDNPLMRVGAEGGI